MPASAATFIFNGLNVLIYKLNNKIIQKKNKSTAPIILR